MEYLLPGERFDELQRNGYRIIQNPAKFCFGMDAVLLSGFARAKRGEKVLDLGTGTGIIPILMEPRQKVNILRALRYSQKALIWRHEVWPATACRRRSIS